MGQPVGLEAGPVYVLGVWVREMGGLDRVEEVQAELDQGPSTVAADTREVAGTLEVQQGLPGLVAEHGCVQRLRLQGMQWQSSGHGAGTRGYHNLDLTGSSSGIP